MGRLVLFLGILLILVGAAGMVLGIVGVPMQFMNTINQAITPNEADLCKPGEELVEESGAESYSPGLGYGRNVHYYCVNSAGVRRKVTGDFVQNMFGSILPSLGSFAIPILSGGLCTFGFILAALGFVFSRRRTVRPSVYGFDLPTAAQVNVVTRRAAPSGDLAARLRQLDDARQNGLISEEEYQRMRQDILDSMK